MTTTRSSNRAGVWLAAAIVLTLLVLDFFYGSLTRPLLLGQASVQVESDPSGATVVADTFTLGTTPLTDGKLLPGTYVLRVEHPHFEPVRESITVARGDLVQRSLRLEPAFGAMELVSNPRGAAIRLNGELLKELTPATLENQIAGLYEVELFIEGRKPAIQQVDVQRGKTAILTADLNRIPMARLTVDLQPEDAVVEFVDAELRYTPGMSLPPASYQLRVSRTGYAEQVRPVDLRRGTNRLDFDLVRQLGLLTVNVTPATARVNVRANGKTQVYTQPLELPTGRVSLSATETGYRTGNRTLSLGVDGADLVLNLERFNVTPGRKFRDPLRSGGSGPELVVLDAGTFRMGDITGKGAADERPAHKVQLRAPFALGVREISRAEWMRQFSPDNSNEPNKELPKTDVTHEQIESYLRWLSDQSGERYRLPSEAEWEYAARSGDQMFYGVAESAQDVCAFANVADATLDKTYDNWAVVPCDDGFVRMAPTGSFAPNSFGLYDMVGNASEWLGDCWHDSFTGAPADGSVWGRKCIAWVSRGGSWDTVVENLRLSFRTRVSKEGGELGLRVVREL